MKIQSLKISEESGRVNLESNIHLENRQDFERAKSVCLGTLKEEAKTRIEVSEHPYFWKKKDGGPKVEIRYEPKREMGLRTFLFMPMKPIMGKPPVVSREGVTVLTSIASKERIGLIYEILDKLILSPYSELLPDARDYLRKTLHDGVFPEPYASRIAERIGSYSELE